jgi:alkylation response protein AidB-like acyl-CoA dehydrogenase
MDVIFDGWRQRSPHYGETHEAVTQTVRRFIQAEAIPHIEQWEEAKIVPREFNRKAGEAGILGLSFPEEYGGTSEGMDIFHSLVLAEELARAGAGGIHAALMTHFVALPPVLLLGSTEMKRRIAPPVLSGEKIMALGVTEPTGGSDVARLKTRAEKRCDRYVVNGSKIFITNGIRADYYTVAVRTGGEGMALLKPSSTRWVGIVQILRRFISTTSRCRWRTSSAPRTAALCAYWRTSTASGWSRRKPARDCRVSALKKQWTGLASASLLANALRNIR